MVASKKYVRNFVKHAIFKLNYSNILSIEVNRPAEFQTKIAERYPRVEQIVGQDFELGFEEITPNIKPISKWVFKNKNETQIIALESKSITIEFLEYKGFIEFKNSIDFILNAFFENYKTIIERIGLRYINIIKDLEQTNPFDFNKYIQNDLLKGIEFYPDKSKISRFMHTLHLNKGENLLKFNYGFANGKIYPTAIIDAEFILDYDCYAQNLNIDQKSEIIEKLDNYHDQIVELFEKSIKSELRNKMGEISDSNN